MEPHYIHEICYLIQSIAELNVISEQHHICTSLCVPMLHSHLTDFLCLWQHFFWGFSGGTTVPSNVTSTGKSQTGTIRCRGSSSRWLIDCVVLCVAAGLFFKHLWSHLWLNKPFTRHTLCVRAWWSILIYMSQCFSMGWTEVYHWFSSSDQTTKGLPSCFFRCLM